MFFSVPKAKLVSHPNFYYCFAYFDIKTLGFADPLFIVPSTEVHKHASPHLEGDRWTFNFGASLDPNSHDHWSSSPVADRTSCLADRYLIPCPRIRGSCLGCGRGCESTRPDQPRCRSQPSHP